MPSDTIPTPPERVEVTVELPAAIAVGHVTVSNSLRDVDSFRVTYTPQRDVSLNLTVPEYMTLYVGQGSVSLPPDVWLKVVEALTEVLAGLSPLSLVSNA
jgi:hypothetical protein